MNLNVLAVPWPMEEFPDAPRTHVRDGEKNLRAKRALGERFWRAQRAEANEFQKTWRTIFDFDKCA